MVNKRLKDENDNIINPITHESAVLDDNGVNIGEKLNNMEDMVAEVEADLEDFERNLNSGFETFKVDVNSAMTAHKNEVSEELESVNSQLEHIENNTISISIKDFGAKVDGVTDDTIAIQKALDFAKTNGGKVVFPSGVTMVSNLNIIYEDSEENLDYGFSSPTLSGANKRASIIKQISGSEGDIFTFKGKTNGTGHNGKITALKVENLQLEGTSTGGNGITIETFNDISFENLYIRKCGGSGIYFARNSFSSSYDSYAYSFNFNNCKIFLNNGYGITSDINDSIGGGVITNCDIHGNELGGIKLNPCNVVMNGGIIAGNNGVGCDIVPNGENSTSTNFTFQAYGTRFEGNADTEIKINGIYSPLLSNITCLGTHGADCMAIGEEGEVFNANIVGGFFSGNKEESTQMLLRVGSRCKYLNLVNPRVQFGEFYNTRNNPDAFNIINDLGESSNFNLNNIYRTPITFARDSMYKTIFSSKLDADLNLRFFISTNGTLYWGDGVNTQDVYLERKRDNTLSTLAELHTGVIAPQTTSAKIYAGSGSPEGNVIASPGSIYLRSDDNSEGNFYVKESGVSNTGWVLK